MSKVIVKRAKPRNPLVAAALLRHAGPHRGAAGADRRAAQRALRREVAALARQRGGASAEF